MNQLYRYIIVASILLSCSNDWLVHDIKSGFYILRTDTCQCLSLVKEVNGDYVILVQNIISLKGNRNSFIVSNQDNEHFLINVKEPFYREDIIEIDDIASYDTLRNDFNLDFENHY